jgi:pimeloyl-ACP methyl ester carboxylesterase
MLATAPPLWVFPHRDSNHAAWQGVQIRGAGTGNMNAAADFIAEIIARAGKSGHLIGHSYGRLTAFASARNGKASPPGLITFAGKPIYATSVGDASPLPANTHFVRQRFEDAYAAGDPDAPGVIIDHWGRQGRSARCPRRLRTIADPPLSPTFWIGTARRGSRRAVPAAKRSKPRLFAQSAQTSRASMFPPTSRG